MMRKPLFRLGAVMVLVSLVLVGGCAEGELDDPDNSETVLRIDLIVPSVVEGDIAIAVGELAFGAPLQDIWDAVVIAVSICSVAGDRKCVVTVARTSSRPAADTYDKDRCNSKDNTHIQFPRVFSC